MHVYTYVCARSYMYAVGGEKRRKTHSQRPNKNGLIFISFCIVLFLLDIGLLLRELFSFYVRVSCAITNCETFIARYDLRARRLNVAGRVRSPSD